MFIPVIVVHIDLDHLIFTVMRILLILVCSLVTFHYFSLDLWFLAVFDLAHTGIGMGCTDVNLLRLFAVLCIMAWFATIVAKLTSRVRVTLLLVVLILVSIRMGQESWQAVLLAVLVLI